MRVNFSFKISDKDRRSLGDSFAFMIIPKIRSFAAVLYITLGETNVWIIPLGAHTWERGNRYAIEPPGGGWEHEPRAMCNHSINYVTARSRLFLLRTHARSARRAVARQTRQSRLHRRGRVLLSSLAYSHPYRSVAFHRDSVTHLSPFGCPETERKHRRDPDGIDGEHIREDVAPLSVVLSSG